MESVLFARHRLCDQLWRDGGRRTDNVQPDSNITFANFMRSIILSVW